MSKCDLCAISDRNESSTTWSRWHNKFSSMSGGHANCGPQDDAAKLGLQFACLRDGSDSSGSHNQNSATKYDHKKPQRRQRRNSCHRDDKKTPSIRSNVSQCTREQGGCQEDRAAKRSAPATRCRQSVQHARCKSVVVDVRSCLAQLSIQLIFLAYFIHFNQVPIQPVCALTSPVPAKHSSSPCQAECTGHAKLRRAINHSDNKVKPPSAHAAEAN